MKTNNEILQMIRTATLFGIGMLLSTIAFAETTVPAQTFLQFLDNHPALRAKADLNNDGVIDKLEIKKAKKALKWHPKPKNLEKIQEFYENHPKLADKADLNDDGIIGRYEAKKVKKVLKENRVEKTKQYFATHPKAAVKADKNNDGKVGKVEARKARKILKAKHH